MERKTIRFEIKAVDADAGIIEGYGATFSKIPDSYGDVVDPGAFTKTLKENADSIVSLFNHNVNEPIGLPELKEDAKGLYAKIRLVMEIERARDVMALARAGVIKRMSFGYDTIKSDFIEGVRHLKEVRLYDVSPVVFAANREARILAVKDIGTMSNEDLNDLERAALEEMKRRVSTKVKGKFEALHALLEASGDDEEPKQFTPPTPGPGEADKLDVILAGLKAENSGFNRKEAEARIDSILAQLRK
jgi:hypothetical protein